MRQTLAKNIFGAATLALATLTLACGDSPVATSFPKLEREADGTCSIPEDEIFSGGVRRDGIPALSDPPLVSPDHPDATYVRSWDRVIGMEIDDTYIAVPHNILWWHEIVNFSALSKPLAVTYCPLTGSSMVFDRTAAGGAEFGVSGLLFQNNLILYDRSEEQSLWPQMLRGARCGPRDGQQLEMVPSIEMRWDAWVGLHPDTKVIGISSGLNRNYQQYPYGDYESLNNERTLFPQDNFDGRRPPKERVLGIPFASGGGMAFPFTALDSGGDRLVVHSRPKATTSSSSGTATPRRPWRSRPRSTVRRWSSSSPRDATWTSKPGASGPWTVARSREPWRGGDSSRYRTRTWRSGSHGPPSFPARIFGYPRGPSPG